MSRPVRCLVSAVVLAVTAVPVASAGTASASQGEVRATRSWCC